MAAKYNARWMLSTVLRNILPHQSFGESLQGVKLIGNLEIISTNNITVIVLYY